jgi:hypothetical protein
MSGSVGGGAGGTVRLEAFLEDVLRAELDKVLAARDAVYDRASQCRKLQLLLADVDELIDGGGLPAAGPAGPAPAAHLRPMTTLVDLGNHFFAKCEVADTSVVSVNIGCGVVLPMTRDEARQFLVTKERLLRSDGDRLTKEALRVKYRMRLVMEAIARINDKQVGR